VRRGDQPRVLQRGTSVVQLLNDGLDVVVEGAGLPGRGASGRVNGQQHRRGLSVQCEVLHHKAGETGRFGGRGGVDAECRAQRHAPHGQEHKGFTRYEAEGMRDETEDVGGA
jgi:hypothetical protein